MKTKTIRQSVTFPASPHDVYEALMDSKKHAKFTGCAAKISRKVGGRFTAMESLRGRNVELVPDQKIVQSWQCDIEEWPKSQRSTLTIRLKPTAQRHATRLRAGPRSCHLRPEYCRGVAEILLATSQGDA
jgi:uncharacterized protein YndB with AHSA1/START domain